jgi:glutamyl-tRNA synthetase
MRLNESPKGDTMTDTGVRTRFAPSPTGMMHVGNLRTALFEYLIARSSGGQFILRIEDTDQERLVDGAVEIIYRTLHEVGLTHDEGPDIGGPYGPYVQSERRHLYHPYADQLVAEGHAYPCFCTRERLEQLREQAGGASGSVGFTGGYDRHCRDLAAADAQVLLDAKTPHVIRQKMPLTGNTTFIDAVYGSITVENSELEDQVLIKSDGFPTYNFANVVDDHLMAITHVVRGSEYLSSTPKYNQLYKSFGWTVPIYVHLPLILGADGKKLSKRHGSTSYYDLIAEGYLPETITNAIALLGWCPKDNQEIFSLEELCKAFSINGISKSPSVFDFDKLDWFNAAYIKAMDPAAFVLCAQDYLPPKILGDPEKEMLAVEILKPRINKLTEIPQRLSFVDQIEQYPIALFENKKSKSTLSSSLIVLDALLPDLTALPEWSRTALHDCIMGKVEPLAMKTGQVMWPLRIAVSGLEVTPGGAIEVLYLTGREDSLQRLESGRQKLAAIDCEGAGK